MTCSYILTTNSVTILYEGRILSCTASHSRWDDILSALKDRDCRTAVGYMKPVDALREFTKSEDSIRVEPTCVLYNGEPIGGFAVDRLLELNAQGFDVTPMVNFLANLQENPSYRSREQLYQFLECNNMPLTEDGCFMAYKRVTDDYMDLHTQTISNKPGQVVEMPRSQVDDDPTRTCSVGLHVCSREYLEEFDGDRLVACKVNPRDVVAVPTDYDFTKMRVARYEVTEELPISLVTTAHAEWDAPVYDPLEYLDDDMGFHEHD